MDKKTEIKRRLQEAVGVNPNLPITAEVVAVSGKTCSAKLASGLVVTDVRLCSVDDDSQTGLVICPKIGSEVTLLSQTGKLSGLAVVKTNEVDTITYKAQGFEFTLDGVTKKVTIKNDQANVGQLIGNLIQTISAAQVICPDGVGTISPATQTQLELIKTQFETVLNTD